MVRTGVGRRREAVKAAWCCDVKLRGADELPCRGTVLRITAIILAGDRRVKVGMFVVWRVLWNGVGV